MNKILNGNVWINDEDKTFIRVTSKGEKPVKYGLTGNLKYSYKTISHAGKSRVYVHRLVWETFNGPIPTKMTIDHIDGDRYNNRLDNLQLLTRAENSRKTLIQTMANNDNWANWKEKKIKCIETGVEYKSLAVAAKEIGVTRQTISNHLRRTVRKNGYIQKQVKGLTYKYV